MKLMKKFKIGMISGLCTTALMAGTLLATSCSTTTTNKTDKKVGLTNTPDNSVYHTITFKANDATETLTGKLVVQARHENKWSSVKKPVATKPDYNFHHWQYMSGSTPTELTDATKVTGDWTVTPVFVPLEKYIIIEGPSVVKATDPNAVFKAYNFPKAEDADPIEGLHWTVEGWTGDTAYRPSMVTTEDEEGNEVVRLSTVANAVGTATIQATDEASNVVAKFEAAVQDPTLDSNEVWTVIVDDFGSRWATLSMDDLTSTSESIHYKFIGTTSGDDGSIGRGVFNQEIKIGNYVDYIPDNFLNNCAAFGTNGTGKVTFVDEEDNPASCTRIGEYFMENCQNFNSPLALPSTIKRIDDGFMADCIKFNNGQTTAISNFYMPTSLTHIGDEFLYDCQVFSQNFTIPATVNYIGFEFMQNCKSMQGTVTVGGSVNAFQWSTGCLSFATLSDTAPVWFNNGITIRVNDDTEATALATMFPTITGTEGTSSNWRKLNITHG